MPYVPSFAGNSLGVGPALEAVIPASILSAAIGMTCLGASAVFQIDQIPVEGPGDVLGGLFLAGLVLGVGAVAATFIVAFYLCVFGLPIALLLQDRIRHPLALGISVLDACAGAVIATTGSALGILNRADFWPWSLVIALSFALPAGYFYRRNIIALRDQADFN